MEFAKPLQDFYVFFLFPGLILTSICLLKRKSHLPLPPGPRKLPIVGNLFQFPSSLEWEIYAKWSEEYKSDIIHLDAVGVSIVVLNSHKAVTELFERRSAIYSSRVQTVMLHELTGWGRLFALMPYNDTWKKHRKLFTQHFHPSDAQVHHPHQLEYTHKMVRRLLDSPEKFMAHSRFLAGAMTISMAYGLEIQKNDDPYLELAEKSLISLTQAGKPGGFLVNSIPLLKYIPDWMPGADFKRKAKEWNGLATDMMEVPFEAAQKAIAEGTAKPSFVSLCLAELDETADIEERNLIRETAGNVFAGGSDTVVSAMNTFILAMTCNPDIQRKAQEELDRVIAPGQLPVFDDEPSLPYIAAIVKEVIRWQSTTPLGVPHYLTEDDEYNGYLIPKGSIVIGNSWAISHNKEYYPNPFEFRPERFIKEGKLDPNVPDPSFAAFGFGRRVCPGQHIALSTLWIIVATILTVYDVSPEIDHDGHPLLPNQEYVPALILHPAPFKCRIRPRSEKAKELILSLDISSF